MSMFDELKQAQINALVSMVADANVRAEAAEARLKECVHTLAEVEDAEAAAERERDELWGEIVRLRAGLSDVKMMIEAGMLDADRLIHRIDAALFGDHPAPEKERR